MKKKIIFSLIILTLIFTIGVCYYQFGQTTFDRAFQCYDIEPPAEPAVSFHVRREGTYPGLSDAPVTFDEGRDYRELLAALRGQAYLHIPSLLGAPDGGTAFYTAAGCTPECMAYWDGTFLWLASDSSRWRCFLPLPPGRLGEKLELIFMDEPEEDFYCPPS